MTRWRNRRAPIGVTVAHVSLERENLAFVSARTRIVRAVLVGAASAPGDDLRRRAGRGAAARVPRQRARGGLHDRLPHAAAVPRARHPRGDARDQIGRAHV